MESFPVPVVILDSGIFLVFSSVTWAKEIILKRKQMKNIGILLMY
jgi:hypothetical protein